MNVKCAKSNMVPGRYYVSICNYSLFVSKERDILLKATERWLSHYTFSVKTFLLVNVSKVAYIVILHKNVNFGASVS